MFFEIEEMNFLFSEANKIGNKREYNGKPVKEPKKSRKSSQEEPKPAEANGECVGSGRQAAQVSLTPLCSLL